MTTALVTGATGFIGRNLCRVLTIEGIEPVALLRPGAGNIDGLTSVAANLGDPDEVRHCLQRVKPNILFHLAGVTSARRNLDAVVPTFQVNLTSTVNLLTAATLAGCDRVILAGSLEEPTAPGDGVPASSPYAASKWAASMYARMFWELYQTPVTVARIFMVYGPGQRDEAKLIPHTVQSLLSGREPRLSSGTRQVDWVFVDDVASGLVAVGRARNCNGTTVDIGTGVLTSVRDVVERIAELVGGQTRPTFGAVPERPGEQVRRADVGRSQALIGWKPRTGLDEGLAMTVDWYRAIRWSDDRVGFKC